MGACERGLVPEFGSGFVSLSRRLERVGAKDKVLVDPQNIVLANLATVLEL